MTTRRHISTRARAALFERDKGVCHMCGLKIDAGQEWEASHRIPLACGGADDMSNISPAHRRCHQAHTAQVDAPQIAKVRRQRQNHIGASQPKGTIKGRPFTAVKRKPKRLDPAKSCQGPSALARRMGIGEGT